MPFKEYFNETIKFTKNDENDRLYIQFKKLVYLNILNDDEVDKKFIVNIKDTYFDIITERFIDTDNINIFNEIKYSDFQMEKVFNLNWFKKNLDNNYFTVFYEYLIEEIA